MPFHSGSSTVIHHLELDEEIPVCRGPCEITRRFEGITCPGRVFLLDGGNDRAEIM